MDETTLINTKEALEKCTDGCPICCKETLAELEAKNSHRLQNRVMNLCSAAWLMLIAAEIFFSWHGKKLDIPVEAYFILSAPFGSKKLAEAISKKLAGKSK